MADPKISTFIIALVWISFFSLVFAYFTSNLAVNYGQYNPENNISQFNELDSLRLEAEKYRDLSDIQEPGILDVIGGYFSGAYNTIRATFVSINIFNGMLEKSMDSTTIPVPLAGPFKTALMTTLLIIIIIGVGISAILKWRT